VIPEVQPPLTEEELAELLHEKVLRPKGRYRHAELDLIYLTVSCNRFTKLIIADQRTWDLNKRERRAFRDYLKTLENLEADCRHRGEESAIVTRMSLMREADKFAAKRKAILDVDDTSGIVGAWAGLQDWQAQRDSFAEALCKTLETADPPIECGAGVVDRFIAALFEKRTGKQLRAASVKTPGTAYHNGYWVIFQIPSNHLGDFPNSEKSPIFYCAHRP
jgi:hypothetical protein